MKILLTVEVFMLLLISLVACDITEQTTSINHTAIDQTNPPSVSEEVQVLVDSISVFTINLYQELKEVEQDNFLYSPYSIFSALAMIYSGAQGNTSQQIGDVLHYTLTPESLNSSYHTLFENLQQQKKNMIVVHADGELTEENTVSYRLKVVNALWGQESYNFLPEYVSLIENYYSGNFNILDFVNEPELSCEEINRWVNEQTGGRINNLITPNQINTLTRFLLTNTIYFNARWESEFSEESTDNNTFYLLNGSSVTVPMMHQKYRYYYIDIDGCQAVRLPYLGNKLAMTILLPDDGDFTVFENSLNENTLQYITDNMETREIDLYMPKFSCESNYNLEKLLSEIGMPDAFDQNSADFSGITGTKDMFIDTVIHKTYISVDEAGTEAAAISAIVMAGAGPPSDPIDFVINRPFIFLISDLETGTILFIGRIMDPTI